MVFICRSSLQGHRFSGPLGRSLVKLAASNQRKRCANVQRMIPLTRLQAFLSFALGRSAVPARKTELNIGLEVSTDASNTHTTHQNSAQLQFRNVVFSSMLRRQGSLNPEFSRSGWARPNWDPCMVVSQNSEYFFGVPLVLETTIYQIFSPAVAIGSCANPSTFLQLCGLQH